MIEISGQDRADIANTLYEATYQLLLNLENIQRIANYFNNGDISEAFRDCIRKGISELISLCDMDDMIREQVDKECE